MQAANATMLALLVTGTFSAACKPTTFEVSTKILTTEMKSSSAPRDTSPNVGTIQVLPVDFESCA